MYFYTPILISPFSYFVEEFGSNIRFGKYAESMETSVICGKLIEIIQSENYNQMCQCAHEKVKSYSWDSYIERMKALILNSIKLVYG